MAQPDTTYLKEIQKNLGYFAAWLPSDSFELGEYGAMDGKQFERLGRINRWITPNPSSKSGGTIFYTSKGDVSWKVDFGVADASKKASVDVKISFKKKSSIFFLAQETTVVTTKNLRQVGEKLVDVYKEKGKDWKLEYVWISDLVKAKRLLVLIALESGVSVTLSGKLPITYQGKEVAELDLRELSLTKGMSSVTKFDPTDATPLFRLYEVKDPITKKAYYTEYK